MDVHMPTEVGGGGATKPEQLFASGYAACSHSALGLVGSGAGVDTTDSQVSPRCPCSNATRNNIDVTLSVV